MSLKSQLIFIVSGHRNEYHNVKYVWSHFEAQSKEEYFKITKIFMTVLWNLSNQ